MEIKSNGFAHLSLILILLLLVAIPLGIYLVRNQQLFKSKAYLSSVVTGPMGAPATAPDFSITLVPNNLLYTLGQTVRIGVYVKNLSEAANLLVVKLKYPADLLSNPVLDKSPGTFVESWTQDIIDETNSTISIVAELKNLNLTQNSKQQSDQFEIENPGFISENSKYGSLLANIDFTARNSGYDHLVFDSSSSEPSAIYSATNNQNILQTTTPAIIAITSQTQSGFNIFTNPPEITIELPINPPALPPGEQLDVEPNTKEDQSGSSITPACQPYVEPICRLSLVPCATPTPPPGGWCDRSTSKDPAAIYPDKGGNILNSQDFSRLKSYYNLSTANAMVADINNDGTVNTGDRNAVLCAMGKIGIYNYPCSVR